MATATKAVAHYRDRPNDNQRCGKCVMFRAPDRCSKVIGEIQPTGWCRFFESKGTTAMATEKKRDWYGKKKAGGDGEKKPENMHERHMRERGETHERHAKARDDMHEQHQQELAQMAERQANEMAAGPGEGAAGGAPAPAAMNTAGAGAAAGTPAAVAGAG